MAQLLKTVAEAACACSVLSLAPDANVQPHCIALNSIQRRVRAMLPASPAMLAGIAAM